MIEPVLHLLYIRIDDGFEVGTLGIVLTDQPIGGLVKPSLPGMIGMGEIDLRLQPPADALMR